MFSSIDPQQIYDFILLNPKLARLMAGVRAKTILRQYGGILIMIDCASKEQLLDLHLDVYELCRNISQSLNIQVTLTLDYCDRIDLGCIYCTSNCMTFTQSFNFNK